MYQNFSHIVGTHLLELKEFKHLLVLSVSKQWAMAPAAPAMLTRIDSGIPGKRIYFRGYSLYSTCQPLNFAVTFGFHTAYSLRLPAIPWHS